MERMGTEYQKFNGKEYVSLRRFWNMEGKYKTEKAKNEELEEENKKLKEEIETLNMRLDNKEKLNEEYRKQIDKYKEQYQHSMGFSDFGGYDEDEHIVKDENTYRDLDL